MAQAQRLSALGLEETFTRFDELRKAVDHVDQLLGQLQDAEFEALPREYRRLANAVSAAASKYGF